jgi:DNA replication protein DnaC
MNTTLKPEADLLELLHRSLAQLQLTSLARGLSALLDQAQKDAPGYTEFLRRAFEIEHSARLDRKVQRRIRCSKLGPYVDLDEFDFSARPELSANAVKEFLTCRFVEEKRNVILVGRPSTGKTTVARAIGHAACRRLHHVYYISMGEMLEELMASRADHTYRKVFRRVTRPALLIVDDAGFSNLNPEHANDLFRVVAARYRKASTLMVSNLPFKQWAELMPSEPQAVAIVDRLIDDASILRFSGKPFRTPRDVHGAPLEGELKDASPVAASSSSP